MLVARISLANLAVLLALTACCGDASLPGPEGRDAPTDRFETSAEGPTSTAAGGSVLGAGSTFVDPLLKQWSRTYYQKTETEIVYDAVGSAAGLRLLAEGRAEFAATDIPLPRNELERRGYLQWPIAAGAVVPVVNLPAEPGELVLDGPVLASVFLGEIDTWSHPRIRTLNSGLKLPDSPITVIQRGDASGTAYNFSRYLSDVSLAWRQRLGVWSPSAPPVGLPAQGNVGVARLVRSIPNSIGYVSFAYALQAELSYASMTDGAAGRIRPSVEAFRSSVETAAVDESDFTLAFTDEDRGEAWPILATTYVVVKKPAVDPEAARRMLEFFGWCLGAGSGEAEKLRYVAMPRTVLESAQRRWEADLGVTAAAVGN